MLASKRSCCTIFFMATRFEELDMLTGDYNAVRCDSSLAKEIQVWGTKAKDDDIRIPVIFWVQFF